MKQSKDLSTKELAQCPNCKRLKDKDKIEKVKITFYKCDECEINLLNDSINSAVRSTRLVPY